jgi:hypothetical protein
VIDVIIHQLDLFLDFDFLFELMQFMKVFEGQGQNVPSNQTKGIQ